MTVMKEVSDWRWVATSGYLNVPHPVERRIEVQYATETERSCALGEWWVNTQYSPSWDHLALALYYAGEDRAVEKVSQYLPKGTHIESVHT